MRKQGAKFKKLCVNPLGIKSVNYEMNARAGLLAIQANCHSEQHLADLYVLAELCHKLVKTNDDAWIKTHSDTVQRMIESIFDKGRSQRSEYLGLETSVNLLLGWFHTRSNKDIAKIATHIDYLLAGVVPAKYQNQMLWQMECTGRKWCDFVSYDPRLPIDLQLFIVRFERDDEALKKIRDGVVAFWNEVSETVSKLNNLKGNK